MKWGSAVSGVGTPSPPRDQICLSFFLLLLNYRLVAWHFTAVIGPWHPVSRCSCCIPYQFASTMDFTSILTLKFHIVQLLKSKLCNHQHYYIYQMLSLSSQGPNWYGGTQKSSYSKGSFLDPITVDGLDIVPTISPRERKRGSLHYTTIHRISEYDLTRASCSSCLLSTLPCCCTTFEGRKAELSIYNSLFWKLEN